MVPVAVIFGGTSVGGYPHLPILFQPLLLLTPLDQLDGWLI